MGGGFRHWRESMAKSADDLENERLKAQSSRLGATAADCLPDREVATVCGRVTAVTMPPIRSVPMLVVEVSDGTVPVQLVWLGRRQIRGLSSGTNVTATGRITRVKGVPTIYNPRYTIRAAGQ